MINKINSQANIDAMLAAMRQYQVDAAGKNTQPVLAPPTPEIGKPTFGDAIKTAVVQTNETQQYASRGLAFSFARFVRECVEEG